MGDLGEIFLLMMENKALLRAAFSEVEIDISNKDWSVMNPEVSTKSADAIKRNIATINGLWKDYMVTYFNDRKILADKFVESRANFVSQALKPAVVALRSNYYEATKINANHERELFTVASTAYGCIG